MSPANPKYVYTASIFLSTGLFIFHTWMLFETTLAFSFLAPRAITSLGVHLGGPILILSTFLVLFLVHLMEAAMWALFFHRLQNFGGFGEALYFCGTSLTALGYGDVILKRPWQNLGPIMATNGILMFGCSTAFLFIVVQKIWATLESHALPGKISQISFF